MCFVLQASRNHSNSLHKHRKISMSNTDMNKVNVITCQLRPGDVIALGPITSHNHKQPHIVIYMDTPLWILYFIMCGRSTQSFIIDDQSKSQHFYILGMLIWGINFGSYFKLQYGSLMMCTFLNRATSLTVIHCKPFIPGGEGLAEGPCDL